MLIKTLFATISKPIPQQVPVHSSWFYDEVDDNVEHWSMVTRIRMMAILLLDTYGDESGGGGGGDVGGQDHHHVITINLML